MTATGYPLCDSQRALEHLALLPEHTLALARPDPVPGLITSNVRRPDRRTAAGGPAHNTRRAVECGDERPQPLLNGPQLSGNAPCVQSGVLTA
jgi:hypothetical protein